MNILIFANGENTKITDMPSFVFNADYIIAADGGIFNCFKHNIQPHCIIGDLDSYKDKELHPKTKIIHLTEQNSTDMEKAIEHAKTLNPDIIDVFCSFGKRMDHTLGNIFILNNYTDMQIYMHDAYGTMYGLNPGEKLLTGLAGTTVSLFALSKVENISLSGFEYPLLEESIGPAFIGVSNKIVSDKATIKFKKGRLIVYQLTKESKK